MSGFTGYFISDAELMLSIQRR